MSWIQSLGFLPLQGSQEAEHQPSSPGCSFLVAGMQLRSSGGTPVTVPQLVRSWGSSPTCIERLLLCTPRLQRQGMVDDHHCTPCREELFASPPHAGSGCSPPMAVLLRGFSGKRLQRMAEGHKTGWTARTNPAGSWGPGCPVTDHSMAVG